MCSARSKLFLLGLAVFLLSANATVPWLMRPVNNLMQDRVGPVPTFSDEIVRTYSRPYRYHLEDFRGEAVTIHYGFKRPGLFDSPFFDPDGPYVGAFYGAYAFGPESRIDEDLLRGLVVYDLKGLVLEPFHPDPEVSFSGPGELAMTTPTHDTFRPRLSYLQYGWVFGREAGTLATYHYDQFSVSSDEGTLTYYALAVDPSLVERTIQALKEATIHAD